MIQGGYTTPNVWDHDNLIITIWCCEHCSFLLTPSFFVCGSGREMKRPREGLDGLLDWFDLDLCPKICAELIAPLGTEKPMNRCLCSNMFLHLNLFRPSQLCPNPWIAFLVGPWINTFTYKSVALPRVKQILAQITYLFRFDGPMAMGGEREREISTCEGNSMRWCPSSYSYVFFDVNYFDIYLP